MRDPDLMLVTCGVSFFLTDNADKQQKKEFLAELELMKTMAPHPNVVGLVACATKSGQWSICLHEGLLLFLKGVKCNTPLQNIYRCKNLKIG